MKLSPQNRRRLSILALLGVILVLGLRGMGMWFLDMPGRSWKGAPPPLTAEELELRIRLKAHVEALAGRIGERNVQQYPKALRTAAVEIQRNFEACGLTVTDQAFSAGDQRVRNIIVELPGAARPGEILVVGAHYDTNPGTPGADDNASGVAALIELARLLRGRSMARTVRLVAFVNEEAPWFGTDAMGSMVYAREARRRDERIIGMVSLECIGFYSNVIGSQKYPFPLNLLYPSRGNFIGFVSNTGSRGLVRSALAAFRRQARFPSEGAAVPAWIPGVGWSDHWAFWQADYPAVMVTDTAFFRNPHYHEPTDTPDKLDYESLARVTTGLARVIEELANAQERLERF